MGGNRSLKGKTPEGPTHRYRAEGVITKGQCLIKVGVRNHLPDRQFLRVDALIDTGATCCAVSQKFATALELVPNERGSLGGAGGVQPCSFATACIMFPKQDGQALAKLVRMAILPINVPMIFGIEGMAPGYLVVDMMKGTWRWTLPAE